MQSHTGSRSSQFHLIFFTTPALMAGICCMFIYNAKIVSTVGLGLIILLLIGIITGLLNNLFQQIALITLLFFAGGALRFWHIHSYFLQNHKLAVSKKISSWSGVVCDIDERKTPYGKRSVMKIKPIFPEFGKSDQIELSFDHSQIRNFEVSDHVCIDAARISQKWHAALTKYYEREGIIATASAGKECNIHLLQRPKWSLKRFIWNLRNNIVQSISEKTSHNASILFSWVFLGKKPDESPIVVQLRRTFLNWGISHYLARSGLHLVMLIFLWNYAMAYWPLSYFMRHYLLLAIAFVYALLSWSSVSFLRALLFFIFVRTYRLFLRQTHSLHLFCLVTTLVLLYQPLHLFFIDFQLSFGLTFLLLWINYWQQLPKNKKVTL